MFKRFIEINEERLKFYLENNENNKYEIDIGKCKLRLLATDDIDFGEKEVQISSIEEMKIDEERYSRAMDNIIKDDFYRSEDNKYFLDFDKIFYKKAQYK